MNEEYEMESQDLEIMIVMEPGCDLTLKDIFYTILLLNSTLHTILYYTQLYYKILILYAL